MGENRNVWKRGKMVEPPFHEWAFHVLEQWLTIKTENRSLKPFFEDNELKRVAVYGLGVLGRHFCEELWAAGLSVRCGIDRNAAKIRIDGLEIRTLEEELPKVDVVVVTPVSFYEIERELRRRLGREPWIVSIEDVVRYCLGRENE